MAKLKQLKAELDTQTLVAEAALEQNKEFVVEKERWAKEEQRTTILATQLGKMKERVVEYKRASKATTVAMSNANRQIDELERENSPCQTLPFLPSRTMGTVARSFVMLLESKGVPPVLSFLVGLHEACF